MRKTFLMGAIVVPLLVLGMMRVASAGPIVTDIWYEFAFSGPGIPATGCAPADPAGPGCAPSSGTPTVFADAPPWTITTVIGEVIFVTDAFLRGDIFDVFDFAAFLFSTSAVGTGGSCGDDPVPCLADPLVSNGSFGLAAGPHSFTITPSASPFGSGAAYFCVSSGSSPSSCGTGTIPEPASLALMSLGLIAAGAILRRRRKSG